MTQPVISDLAIKGDIISNFKYTNLLQVQQVRTGNVRTVPSSEARGLYRIGKVADVNAA